MSDKVEGEDRLPAQTKAVLDLLRANGSAGVTQLQALRDVGTLRLAARVGELRKAGYTITTHTMKVPAQRGQQAAYVGRYTLEEPVEPVQLGFFGERP